jgi:hypothetical protein
MPQFDSGAAEPIGRFSEGLLLRLLQRPVVSPVQQTENPQASDAWSRGRRATARTHAPLP